MTPLFFSVLEWCSITTLHVFCGFQVPLRHRHPDGAERRDPGEGDGAALHACDLQADAQQARQGRH